MDGTSWQEPMYDGTLPFEAGLQRARGEARISIRRAADATRLHRLYQAGAAKFRLPKIHDKNRVEAVLINTAGGLTGGDRFSVDVAVEENAHAVVTTQACERVYKSLGSDAVVENRLAVASGACLEWIPQETLFFDGGALKRSIEVDLAQDASALLMEPLVFGRQAMGESVTQGRYRDRWRVRVAGRLAYADNANLDGDIARDMQRLGTGKGALAFVSGLFVGPDPAGLRDRLREDAPATGIEAGVSVARDVLILRAASVDSQSLRRWIAHVFQTVTRRDLPRAWYC